MATIPLSSPDDNTGEGKIKKKLIRGELSRSSPSSTSSEAFSEAEIDVARQLVQLSVSTEEDGGGGGGEEGMEASSGIDRDPGIFAFVTSETNDPDGELRRRKRRYRSIQSIYGSSLSYPDKVKCE